MLPINYISVPLAQHNPLPDGRTLDELFEKMRF